MKKLLNFFIYNLSKLYFFKPRLKVGLKKPSCLVIFCKPDYQCSLRYSEIHASILKKFVEFRFWFKRIINQKYASILSFEVNVKCLVLLRVSYREKIIVQFIYKNKNKIFKQSCRIRHLIMVIFILDFWIFFVDIFVRISQIDRMKSDLAEKCDIK